jgi:hypothetical protein
MAGHLSNKEMERGSIRMLLIDFLVSFGWSLRKLKQERAKKRKEIALILKS